jgi:hypothetical protein
MKQFFSVKGQHRFILGQLMYDSSSILLTDIQFENHRIYTWWMCHHEWCCAKCHPVVEEAI